VDDEVGCDVVKDEVDCDVEYEVGDPVVV